MALPTATSLLRPRRSIAYHRILVPFEGGAEAERALELACRLASEHRATITAVTVIEIPAHLPAAAHMIEEEAEARRLLAQAHALADGYGVRVIGRVLRGREAGAALVEEVIRTDAELVVLGARRKQRIGRRAALFGRTVRFVLERAPCRVMLVAARSEP